MNAILLALLSMSHPAQGMSVECTAYMREVTPQRQQIEMREILKPVWESGKAFVLEASIKDRAYSVSTSGDPLSYLLTISKGPDYLEGVNATAVPNQEGRMQVSTIEQSQVHKLECRVK